jgi:hypothetical protein
LDDAGAFFMSDETDLKNAIDQCESCLEPLLDDVQARLNDAIAAGQSDLAQTLLIQFRQLSFAIGAISDQKIVQIDSSAEMAKAIAGFQGVNKSVTAQLNQLKPLQTFVNTLNSILGPLNSAIGIAFNKSSTGAAPSSATSQGASTTPTTGTATNTLMLPEVMLDQIPPATNMSFVKSEFVQPAPPRPRAPKAHAGLAGVILLAVTFAINVRWAGDMLVTIWFLTTAAVALSVALFGLAGGRWEGAFIDNRNRISLSKLQTILWMVMIFSALLSASCFNASLPNAASAIAGIVVDPKLWALLGIAMTTGVGAPLALSGKTTRSPSLPELTDTRKNLLTLTGVSPANVGADGHVLVKADQQDARWSDAIFGDDVGNADTMDFSKIQQLYFTLLTILVFLLAIAKMFGDAATNHSVISQLPVPDAGFLGLLGVSGAGYLAYKSLSHSKDAS